MPAFITPHSHYKLLYTAYDFPNFVNFVKTQALLNMVSGYG